MSISRDFSSELISALLKNSIVYFSNPIGCYIGTIRLKDDSHFRLISIYSETSEECEKDILTAIKDWVYICMKYHIKQQYLDNLYCSL